MTSSPSAAFLLLRTFNAEQMRMSHIYQLQTLPESSRRLRHKPEEHANRKHSIILFRSLPKRKRALSSNRKTGMETPELQSPGEWQLARSNGMSV
ncbi:MAG: hypothetical protein QE276_07290 [Cyanobium sp. D14.bin.5]|nr:hypothetical protein [Cyanobium sp. D14.bin.5]